MGASVIFPMLQGFGAHSTQSQGDPGSAVNSGLVVFQILGCLLLAVWVFQIVMASYAAHKAYNGVWFRYPLTLQILKPRVTTSVPSAKRINRPVAVWLILMLTLIVLFFCLSAGLLVSIVRPFAGLFSSSAAEHKLSQPMVVSQNGMNVALTTISVQRSQPSGNNKAGDFLVFGFDLDGFQGIPTLGEIIVLDESKRRIPCAGSDGLSGSTTVGGAHLTTSVSSGFSTGGARDSKTNTKVLGGHAHVRLSIPFPQDGIESIGEIMGTAGDFRLGEYKYGPLQLDTLNKPLRLEDGRGVMKLISWSVEKSSDIAVEFKENWGQVALTPRGNMTLRLAGVYDPRCYRPRNMSVQSSDGRWHDLTMIPCWATLGGLCRVAGIKAHWQGRVAHDPKYPTDERILHIDAVTTGGSADIAGLKAGDNVTDLVAQLDKSRSGNWYGDPSSGLDLNGEYPRPDSEMASHADADDWTLIPAQITGEKVRPGGEHLSNFALKNGKTANVGSLDSKLVTSLGNELSETSNIKSHEWVYVSEESFSPRFRPGKIRFVHPHIASQLTCMDFHFRNIRVPKELRKN